MALSLYELSVPALVHGLDVMSHLLHKGAHHAAAQGLNSVELTEAKLAPDMLTLAGQVQRASDTAKLGVARLSQGQSPSFEDNEVTFEQLQVRVAKTQEYLLSVAREAIDGRELQEIRFRAGPNELFFVAQDYLRQFLLPNFYFHLTAAYAILRYKGVPLGKLDYLRGAAQPNL